MNQLALALDPAVEAARADPVALLGRSTADVIGFTLDAMAVAEERIAAARDRWPDTAEAVDNAFVVLRPRAELFTGIDPRLLASHMDELLDRIGREGPDARTVDVGLGTAAECCIALKEMSLAAPLHPRYATVYFAAFIDAYGLETAAAVAGEEFIQRADQDRDQHLIADIYGEIRAKLRDPERQAAWRGRCR